MGLVQAEFHLAADQFLPTERAEAAAVPPWPPRRETSCTPAKPDRLQRGFGMGPRLVRGETELSLAGPQDDRASGIPYARSAYSRTMRSELKNDPTRAIAFRMIVRNPSRSS